VHEAACPGDFGEEARMAARNKVPCFAAFFSVMAVFGALNAGEQPSIPAGSKVYVAPMNGFEEYLKTALKSKKVPLEVVDNKEDAAYEITGTASTQKAGKAKKILTGSWRSREEASVKVADLKSGTIVFAYSYVNENSAHGKRSSAEACAKHLKNTIKAQ
jgi:hypothetical protein